MKLPEMKTGLTISACAHAALLLWGMVSFSARPLEAKPTESMPIDIVTSSEFSQMTKGAKNAPKAETPKPLVDKIAEPKPSDEMAAKVSEKPEIKTASAPPPKPPEPKQIEPKAEKKPAPTPEPKQAEAKPEKKTPPPPKVDPIAEALKKEDIKKAAEAKAKAKAAEAKQKPTPPQPKFDPTQIAALLDKRETQRMASAGDTLSPAPSLGTRSGAAAKLSQSELEAMRARLMQLWNPPAGVQNPEQMIVRVRIQLSKDGRLVGGPVVLSSGRGPVFETARDNAIRALFRGQPFDMLSPNTYETWKEIEITFDPRDMYRG